MALSSVRNEYDMRRYCEILFPGCQIEDLLSPPRVDAGCYLFRVKNVCNGDSSWAQFPRLIDEAMTHVVTQYGSEDIIQVVTRIGGKNRVRIYDSMQVNPGNCICRVCFGGDKHHQKVETGSEATAEMGTLIMDKFRSVHGYDAKAFHLVLNRFDENDGMDYHQHISPTYDNNNPITWLSYGRGSILTISDSLKPRKQKISLYYQCPGDAFVMSGTFNTTYWHGIPPMNSWRELFKKDNIVRNLSPDERAAAFELLDQSQVPIGYHAIIGWHQKHRYDCPFRTGEEAEANAASRQQIVASIASSDVQAPNEQAVPDEEAPNEQGVANEEAVGMEEEEWLYMEEDPKEEELKDWNVVNSAKRTRSYFASPDDGLPDNPYCGEWQHRQGHLRMEFLSENTEDAPTPGSVGSASDQAVRVGCPCADCVNGAPPRKVCRSMTDKYVTEIHNRFRRRFRDRFLQ